MYYRRSILKDLFHIGGNDRRLSRFENMFGLPEGISYNSYLLLDDKTVLFDGIDQAVSELHIDAIRTLLSDRPLDYFIVQHVEPDHCTSINAVMRLYPNCKILISDKGKNLLYQFYPDAHLDGIDYATCCQIVKEGDQLDTGHHLLRFIAAPNVHWPEVIMTYDETTGTLFSADAFGSFKALEGHLFADQVPYVRHYLDEARRYYANIVGRQGAAVQKLLKKVSNFPINNILPLHGLCFRTPETIELILDRYNTWSSYAVEEPGVVIVYSSMYGNNLIVADTLAGMLADQGVPNIRVHDISESEISTVISDLFCFSNAVIFGMNYNTELYPKMDALLRELKMLNFANRHISYIGGMSWGGRGLAIAQELIDSCKNMTTIGEPVIVKSALRSDQLNELEDLAKQIAADVNH